MNKVKRFLIIITILVFSIGCDQVTKNIARQNLIPTESYSFLNNTIKLIYVENNGAFLSMGSNWPDVIQFSVLTVLPVIYIIFLFWFLIKNRKLSRDYTIALAFILGGGISNLTDRVLNQGFVTDFLNIGIGSLRTGIFNFADLFIMTGMLTIIYSYTRHRIFSRSSI